MRIVPRAVLVALRVRVRRDLEELREEAAEAVMVKSGWVEADERTSVGLMRSHGMGGVCWWKDGGCVKGDGCRWKGGGCGDGGGWNDGG